MGIAMLLIIFIGVGIYIDRFQCAESALDFQAVIKKENIENLTLTIYYEMPISLTPIPRSVDNLLLQSDDSKVVIRGNKLEEHLNSFERFNNKVLKPKMKESAYIHAYMYYILESKERGKIFDVVMSGSGGGVFVNGVEFEENDVFFDVVMPFLEIQGDGSIVSSRD